MLHIRQVVCKACRDACPFVARYPCLCCLYEGSPPVFAWVVTVCLEMRGHGSSPQFLDWREYAVFVQQVHWGMRKHLVFECPELQCFREQWAHLFEGPETMQAFMWQADKVGVAKFINACLQKMNPSCEGQPSDQPGVAGRDVI